MNTRGQSAIEFMIIVGVVFFLFIAFLGVLQSQRADQIYADRDVAAKEVALTVQDEVNLAQSSRDGYQRTFVLPYELLGLPYTVNASLGFVFVRTIDERHALALPIANVSGQITTGSNTIRKKNGTISLNVP